MYFRSALAAVCGLLVLTSLAFAREQYPGQYANSPNKQWFQGLKNNRGGSCCGEADCHREADGSFLWRNSREGEGYEIMMGRSGKWIPVPDSALTTAEENPTSGALACWNPEMPETIYCFVPPINQEKD
jgi:hypothetical protein